MNNCTFTGYLLNDPQVDKDENGRACCTVKMVTYEYRKSKSGKKKKVPTTITLQAWSSGAETIGKLGRKGTKMTIHASARNGDMKTETTDDTVFRINEFDFGCLDQGII